MLAAFRLLMKGVVYAALVLFAGGLVLFGRADTLLVQGLSLRFNDAVVPVLELLSRPIDAVADRLARVRSWASLAQENARLRQDRERLLRWQAVAQRLEAENSELRGLLKLAPEPQASFVSARVVADSSSAFAHSLLLNVGSFAGIERDQLVLTGEGLAGRIIAVSQRASRVLLITDMGSRIPVFVGSSRVRAVLAGDNSDRPRLFHVVPAGAIRVGDEVVTSGLAGVFPPGLPIGVVEASDDVHPAVKTNIERNRLEYVRVVDYGMATTHVDPPTAAMQLGASKRVPDLRAAAR